MEATSKGKAISWPSLYPAFSTALAIVSKASSTLLRFGAKPPSSPTAVDRPLSFKTLLRAWKTSVPYRNASANVGAPLGMIMNSWKSIGASECAPPLMMFIIGTGRSEEHTSELQSHSDLVCRLLLEKKNAAHPRPVPIDPHPSSGVASGGAA